MTGLQKAIREAARVLREQNVTSVPVRVERIASKWAHIVTQPLDADISGMLVPLRGSQDDRHWAIVVNKAHSEVRQRFTIAHELGHLLLHGYTSTHADRSFKVRLRDTSSSQGSVLEEIEANRFAAELLMPADLVRRKMMHYTMEYAPHDTSDDTEIERLAREFKVSKQALQIRLSSLLG